MSALLLAIHGPGLLVSVWVGFTGDGISAWVQAFGLATLWPVLVIGLFIDSSGSAAIWTALAIFWGLMSMTAWHFRDDEEAAMWIVAICGLISAVQAMIAACLLYLLSQMFF